MNFAVDRATSPKNPRSMVGVQCQLIRRHIPIFYCRRCNASYCHRSSRALRSKLLSLSSSHDLYAPLYGDGLGKSLGTANGSLRTTSMSRPTCSDGSFAPRRWHC
jgi:hypothetical protein